MDSEVKRINFGDKNYPSVLSKIKTSPARIYCRGNLSQGLFRKSLAVVGSRQITRYGREVVERFVSVFVAKGITIVSGFMYGVDTEAHRVALNYGGTTVAVLGSGLNICYPPENRKLYEEIIESNGVVLSEYKPDAKPQMWMFVRRNRIVAGLSSLGVLIVEAGEKSGSLITANYARKYGRRVYAVPGPITSRVSLGCNNLIKSGGARMVTDPEDIVGRSWDGGSRNKRVLENLTNIEIKIVRLLEREPLSVDEISVLLGIDIAELSAEISLMTLRGIITESGGRYYLLNI